jgi:uncharacterized protein YdhG (YjbR/CyaY superfamily)
MTDLDAYVHRQPDEHRRALLELRAAIAATAPDCVESMRRGVPAFLLDGKQLVSIGAARQHVSLYVMYGDALARLAERLAGLDVSNTVVRFHPSRPIPIDVVADIVAFRADEIRNAVHVLDDGRADTWSTRTSQQGWSAMGRWPDVGVRSSRSRS